MGKIEAVVSGWRVNGTGYKREPHVSKMHMDFMSPDHPQRRREPLQTREQKTACCEKNNGLPQGRYHSGAKSIFAVARVPRAPSREVLGHREVVLDKFGRS